jgi:hypothetical protein
MGRSGIAVGIAVAGTDTGTETGAGPERGTGTGTAKESAGVVVAGTAVIGDGAADGSAAAGVAAGATVDGWPLRAVGRAVRSVYGAVSAFAAPRGADPLTAPGATESDPRIVDADCPTRLLSLTPRVTRVLRDGESSTAADTVSGESAAPTAIEPGTPATDKLSANAAAPAAAPTRAECFPIDMTRPRLLH